MVAKIVTNGNFNFWLQYLQLELASTNSCKNRNQIATGKKTQLIVAIFATRIFADFFTYPKMFIINEKFQGSKI